MQHNSADKKHIHQSVIMLAMVTIMASASSDIPPVQVATAIATITTTIMLAAMKAATSTAQTIIKEAVATVSTAMVTDTLATTNVSLMTVLAQFWKNAIYIRWLNGAVR